MHLKDMFKQRNIFVKFQKEGIHCYPDAPDEVAYLRHPHRHMFHFDVCIEVFHDDRELEFIMFKNWLISLYDSGTLQLDHQSCEMMADALAEKISAKYPGRDLQIEVSEDGENGSLTFWVRRETDA